MVEAIRKRRGGTLLNLDRMRLNSPAFAVGWNGFLGAVRTALTLEMARHVQVSNACFSRVQRALGSRWNWWA